VFGIEPLPNENSVVRIDPESGEVTPVAELGSYEADNNPDGTDVNSNIYGMALGDDGQLYVADAGGNTIYSVDPATGDITLVGVIPGPALPGEADAEAATPAAARKPLAATRCRPGWRSGRMARSTRRCWRANRIRSVRPRSSASAPTAPSPTSGPA
jgi:hypothetical protein